MQTHKFCSNDINKFGLMLQKGISPYEYMDNWRRFNKTQLPSKEEFCSSLNIEHIIEMLTKKKSMQKRVWKVFEINNLVEYHDLYVQNYTLLVDAFERLCNKCIQIYKLDRATFYKQQD